MADWIFLRGLIRESRHWGDFVKEFEQTLPNARALMLDLPGNGLLNAEVSPTTVGEMVTAYRAQLIEMGRSPPYRILAVSMGAMVAAEWSHRYPDEVERQVLINTSMRPFSAFFQRLRPANYLTILRLLVTLAKPMQWEAAILRMTTNHPHTAVLPYWRTLREQSPVSSKNAIRQLWAAATYHASTTAPVAATLILASTNDRLVSVHCSRTLAAHWKVPLVENLSAGHDLTLDDSLWVAQQVLAWLK